MFYVSVRIKVGLLHKSFNKRAVWNTLYVPCHVSYNVVFGFSLD